MFVSDPEKYIRYGGLQISSPKSSKRFHTPVVRPVGQCSAHVVDVPVDVETAFLTFHENQTTWVHLTMSAVQGVLVVS